MILKSHNGNNKDNNYKKNLNDNSNNKDRNDRLLS